VSLDIDTIVRVIYLGTQPRAWAPLSPSIFASSEREQTKSWKPDVRRAGEILDRKGWTRDGSDIRQKDGKRLSISFIDTQGNREKRLDDIQLVRRQLARNGIDLSIDSQPAGTYVQKLADGAYDLGGASQFAPDPDVLRRLHLPDDRDPSSISKVNDPEISQWLRQGTTEADVETRAELYRKVQAKLIEKTYAIPIYVLLYNIVTTTRVAGIGIDTHGFPQFHGAWLTA